MATVTGTDAERLARAALACLAEPGDTLLGRLLRQCTPAGIVAALLAGRLPVPDRPGAAWDERRFPAPDLAGAAPGRGGPDPQSTLRQALDRWGARLGGIPTQRTLDAWRDRGFRLVIPGDTEWPGQLDVLGDARPVALWVSGNADLRYACLRSVAVVGTRAATAYGLHVCGELSVALAEHDWTIVSGGAYGIDGCAHRGALAMAGVTVAVLACGLGYAYPAGHLDLFAAMRDRGAVVSEWPPGRAPTRPAFLTRNRVIAALSRGTVVVEAALRSGALNTARHARDQGRPLMAVPGPVTSAQSAGCHQVIRDWGGMCVTGAQDVMGMLSFSSGEAGERHRGPVLDAELLDPVHRKVLEATPARLGQGPARIAVAAGVDFDTVMASLGSLAAGGFIERCSRGWRLRSQPADP